MAAEAVTIRAAAELAEALEHYANEAHWTEEASASPFTTWGYDGGGVLPWAVARAALARWEAREPREDDAGEEAVRLCEAAIRAALIEARDDVIRVANEGFDSTRHDVAERALGKIDAALACEQATPNAAEAGADAGSAPRPSSTESRPDGCATVEPSAALGVRLREIEAVREALTLGGVDEEYRRGALEALGALAAELERVTAEREQERRRVPSDEGGPGHEEVYWLRAKTNAAIRHLRDIEDYHRTRRGLPHSYYEARADRARQLYEAISADLLNGKMSVPSQAEALAAAAAESERLRGALKALLDEFVVRGDNFLGASPSDVAMYRRMTVEALAGGAAAPPPDGPGCERHAGDPHSLCPGVLEGRARSRQQRRRNVNDAHPCPGIAAALTTFQRPVGRVQSYVVECRCGWVSQNTSDWHRSLDDHWRRSQRVSAGAAATPETAAAASSEGTPGETP